MRLATCACAALLACGVAGGCSNEASDAPYVGPDDGTNGDSTAGDTGFQPPTGNVVFDFRAGGHANEPAVRAYVGWQRAATESIRNRQLTDEVRDGAIAPPVRTVERSIATVSDADYTVPRTMVGRLASVRATPRAAILEVCLWSPSFDYRQRESGRTATDGAAHWMGAEVRMTRNSAHDGAWKVAGLTDRPDCEGNKP